MSDDLRGFSQRWKAKKQSFNSITFFKLKTRFNLKIVESRMGMEVFELNGQLYYFSLNKGKIRKKGEKEWNGKVISYLENENIVKEQISDVRSCTSIVEKAKRNINRSDKRVIPSRLDLLREKMNNKK